jgi:branched-chain amino acid transport system substrate-binding protein
MKPFPHRSDRTAAQRWPCGTAPWPRPRAAKLKVGLMLPYTGTFAALGTAIENGFALRAGAGRQARRGARSSSSRSTTSPTPAKATDNVNKLVKRDNVDVIVGTVHSGVAMAMAKVAKDTGTLLIVPNAGADAVTGADVRAQHLPQSFSNWQPGYAMGEVAAKKGHKKAVTITWKYAAGDESVGLQGGLRERAAARSSRS